jgi:hypothetical protein
MSEELEGGCESTQSRLRRLALTSPSSLIKAKLTPSLSVAQLSSADRTTPQPSLRHGYRSVTPPSLKSRGHRDLTLPPRKILQVDSGAPEHQNTRSTGTRNNSYTVTSDPISHCIFCRKSHDT